MTFEEFKTIINNIKVDETYASTVYVIDDSGNFCSVKQVIFDKKGNDVLLYPNLK